MIVNLRRNQFKALDNEFHKAKDYLNSLDKLPKKATTYRLFN